MLLGILKQLNWVDIFVLLAAIRVCYIAIKKGFIVEIFKLFGTVLAIYLAFHYYIKIANFIEGRVKIPGLSIDFLDFVIFSILAVLGYLACVLLRETFAYLLNPDALPKLNKWGGLAVGIIRSVLLSSLIIFMLAFSSVKYLKDSVVTSYSGKNLFRVSVFIYTTIWEKFTSKFMTKEKLNKVIFEVEDSLKI